MKNIKRLLAAFMALCLLAPYPVVVPVKAADTSAAHTIHLSSIQNSDGSYSHTALYDGTAVTEYDYTWHADPSTVHSDVKNSPAEYYTGTEPGDDPVYIAHDIYYYPELDTSGFTKMNYDGEQEWVYYYTAEGYTSYIFSTLPGWNTLPTDMMHAPEDAYENAVLHITQPGDYVITGNWHGQIWVDLENYCDDPFTDPTAKVNLILNGVTVNCTVAAGVVFDNVYECDNTWEDQTSWSYHVDTSDAGAVVTLADGTENNVTGCNIFRILKTQYKSGSTSVQKKRLKIDGAFYSYQSMVIQGQEKGTGVLNITSGYEGLDSELHLTINGGNVNIFSQDDGINVNEDNVSVLTIAGGCLHILAGLGNEGDGIDSNGFISVNGGTVITMANPGSDSGMDSDFGTYIFGGNVVALGSTMDWVENDTSVVYDQATMNLQFSSSKSAGDAIIVTDTTGKGVFAYDPDKDEINGSQVRTYTGAIISSENFEIGQSYRVYIGGEITGTETKGVYDMTTVTAVSNTRQQSYSGTSSSGGNSSSTRPTPGGRPSMGGGFGSGSSGSGGTTTFALSNNVSKFTGVTNYSSATSITVTPMESTGQTCTHSYTTEVTVAADCTRDGIMTYTCSLCDDSYTVTIESAGHNYEWITAEATCTTAGYVAYTCTVCGDSDTTDETPATGHSYEDGACTLCGEADPAVSTVPTITLKYPSLSFEDVIVMNVYYAASDLEDVAEMGLITYSEKVSVYDVETAEHVIPGYAWSEADGYYYSTTTGIAAKELGDTIYFAVYAKLTDGTYTYTKLVGYSPKTYAYNQLKTGIEEMRPLVVAMLNYGAAAQTYFSHNTDALVNADLTADQQALVEDYSDTMIAAVTLPDSTKLGTMVNNGGYSRRYPTISFEGAFCINYYFLPSAAPAGDITMYVWNQEAFDGAQTLSVDNATQAITMTLTETGEYLAAVEGIAAKELDNGVYVSFCYSDGTTDYCSGVIGYSIGQYCKAQAAQTGTMADLAAACAVYGYYAKQLFT